MSRFLLLIPVGLLVLVGADWRQFRGPNSQAVTPEKVPTSFDREGKNIAWKTPLPGRGLSSPIVVDDRVIVTSSDGERNQQLYVLAYDGKTGEERWRRSFWATGPTACHPKTCMAAPTPASDGNLIVALFGTNDLVCVDLEGNLRWVRSLYSENPGATDGRGLASSPLIVGDTVVVHIENQNVSFAAGIDLKTGSNRWHIDRPRELNWTSPIALPGGLVLLQGGTQLSAIDAETGEEEWVLERESDQISSSVVADGILFVPGAKGLAAFRLHGKQSPEELWQELRLNPQTASPVVVNDRVYSMRGSILVTADVKTGKVQGQLRLRGPFSSTPIVAGGTIYCCNEQGDVQIVQPNEEDGELIETCKLGENILCTPAVTDKAMYIRTDAHLWKIME